jgi:type VI secretion system protein
MALQLTIIKFPPGTALGEDRKTFGPQGGLIGRGVDNDWVLSDPERFLSSKHCQLIAEGSQYFLVDLSTNGTFLNGAVEPIGRGSRVALNEGDYFDVGEYRFKVALEQSAPSIGSSPFGSVGATSFADKDPFVVSDYAFGQPKAPAESMFMSGDYKGAIQDIAPDALKITDPLVALDNANKPVGVTSPFQERDPFADPFASSGSQEDSPDPLSESIAWPDAKQGGSLLPEDWADDISLLGARKSKPTPYTLPDEDSLIKSKPQPKADMGAVKDKVLPLEEPRQPSPGLQHTGRKLKDATGAAPAIPRPGSAQQAPSFVQPNAARLRVLWMQPFWMHWA